MTHNSIRGMSISFKMGRCIRVSGEGPAGRGMESRYGQMGQSTSACGRITRLMGKVSSFMPMVTYTKESGLRIKHMEMAGISMLMVLCMRDSGSMISKTDQEWKNGLMDQRFKELTRMV